MQARQKQLEMQQQAQLDQVKAQQQLQLESAKLEFERWRVGLGQEVKLQIAEMNVKPEPIQPDERLDTVLQALQALSAHIASPTEIIRDPSNGRAVGVKRGALVQKVVRDGTGRATGLQ
jgi:hypothetical protein